MLKSSNSRTQKKGPRPPQKVVENYETFFVSSLPLGGSLESGGMPSKGAQTIFSAF